MNWYYEKAGQRQGPVPESELDRLAASGEINATTLVWCEGMANWTPLGQARPSSGQAGAPGEAVPAGWIQCTATGRYFPPSEIVYIDGKAYSAAAKPAVMQGVMQSGVVPAGMDTNRNGPAWEQRAELGIVKAGWETIKAVLTKPAETFETMKRDGGIGSVLLYPVIFGSIGSIAGIAYQVIVRLAMSSAIPQQASRTGVPDPAAMMAMSTGMLVVFAIFMPAFIALGTFIGAGLLHLSLMICGGAKQPFETTFRTYCYVHGSAGMLQIVPVCGAMVSGIWALICLCIGLSKTQEISVGKAVLAVFLPMIVCCGGAVVLFGAIFGVAMAANTH